MVSPVDWFTGNVRVDSLFAPDGGRPSSGGIVTFEPGARTRWHTHPAGQTIILVQGGELTDIGLLVLRVVGIGSLPLKHGLEKIVNFSATAVSR
jgi:hypothetical protein